MARNILKFQMPDGRTLQVQGREAWTLSNLVRLGLKGFSVFDNPGPRLSHYIMKLRRLGLNIETVDVRHGGAFPGVHAKYLLRTPIEVIEETKPTA